MTHNRINGCDKCVDKLQYDINDNNRTVYNVNLLHLTPIKLSLAEQVEKAVATCKKKTNDIRWGCAQAETIISRVNLDNHVKCTIVLISVTIISAKL